MLTGYCFFFHTAKANFKHTFIIINHNYNLFLGEDTILPLQNFTILLTVYVEWSMIKIRNYCVLSNRVKFTPEDVIE